MKVSELLEATGMSGKELASALGFSSSDSVNGRRRRDEDVPDSWLPKLAELGIYAGTPDDMMPPLDPVYRDAESEVRPQAPPGAPQAPSAPVKIDYASVAGYIEGAYKLSAQMAFAQYDPVLADVINEHAEQAGVAWAHYIESEPKVAALLQRMMIGTPIGEVIGVHVAIVFSYTLARATAREMVERAAADAVAQYGGAEAAATD